PFRHTISCFRLRSSVDHRIRETLFLDNKSLTRLLSVTGITSSELSFEQRCGGVCRKIAFLPRLYTVAFLDRRCRRLSKLLAKCRLDRENALDASTSANRVRGADRLCVLLANSDRASRFSAV